MPTKQAVLSLMTKPSFHLSVFFLVFLSIHFVVNARELRLDQSVGYALRPTNSKQGIASDIELRFGTAPTGLYDALSAPVVVTSFARTWEMSNGRNYQREDAQTCDEAFRNTVAEAVAIARKRGANAIVNITSRFLETPLDSPSKFTCNSGISSAVVELLAL
jgi:hypothetical protein